MAALNNKFNCSICLNGFTKPRIIDCHHTFCETCLDDYINKFTVDNKFDCPVCRRAVCVPENGAQGFATNFYVDDLSVVVAEPKRHVGVCERHHEEAMDKFCSDCSQEICCKCMEDHRDHNVEDLQNVLSSLAKELHQLLQDLQERISVIKAYVESIKTELTEYNEATETVCTEVDEQVQQIYEAAKKLGDHFKSQLRRTKMEERTKLVRLQEKRQSDIYQIQSSLVYTKELMKDKSVVNSNDAIKTLMTLKTETDCDSSDALPRLNTGRFTPACINMDLLHQLLGELSNDVDDGVLEHAFDLELIKLDCDKWFYSSEQQIKNTRWRIGLKKLPTDSNVAMIGLCYEGGGDFTHIFCKFTVEIWNQEQRAKYFVDKNTFSGQTNFSSKQIYVVSNKLSFPNYLRDPWTIRVTINRIDRYYAPILYNLDQTHGMEKESNKCNQDANWRIGPNMWDVETR